MTARNQCFRCNSRNCYHLIVSAEHGFDEVACRDHQAELERHADAALPPGAARLHRISSARLGRMLRRSATRVALLLLCLAPAAAQAQRPRRQPARWHYPPRYQAQYQAPAHAAPQAAYPGDGPAEFLAALNAWRASAGRGPLAWDAGLAAAASTNAGVHAPGSSGGAAQCWAGVGSYSQALRMWFNSPAHASILLNAASSVGVSPCPSGMTANAR